MGKKRSWFSAIKRVLLPHPKAKLNDGFEDRSVKEKKKGRRGLLRHGETTSFIPLFREPSSIEKILGEVDQQKLLIGPPTPSSQQSRTPPLDAARLSSPRVTSPRVASPSRVGSPAAPFPRVHQRSTDICHASNRPEPSQRNLHLSASKIQAAYRGYMARRSFRALRGLVRLQGVVRGQNVKRQTMNAMKQMQLVVRVQNQIQMRRIQMLENQALRCQVYRNGKEEESTLSKWTLNQLPESGQIEDWDDSFLTKEARETRLQRKVEATMKRERAMAYAYSQQLWKANPKSAQTALMDIRSGGFPWWWNRLEGCQQPPANSSGSKTSIKNVHLTPPRATSEYNKPSPRPYMSSYKQQNFVFENHETPTPRSSKSAAPMRSRQMHTPSRTPPPNNSGFMKYSKPRSSAAAADSPFDVPLKDDDSLSSCPPFSVPKYMAPTVSAKAKARPSSNPRERLPGTPPGNDSKRRFSFPLTPNWGWNKGSGNNDSDPQKMLERKRHSTHSIDDVDSTVSMPAAVARKPFNRFV